MALAYVQGIGKAGNNVSFVTTDPISTTSGNLLIACWAEYGTFSSVTDSAGNTWSSAGIDQLGFPADTGVRYVANCTGSASHTFTLTLTSANYPDLFVIEVSGAALTSVLDQAASNTTSPGATGHTTPTINTTAANTFIVGYGSDDGNVSSTTYVHSDGTYTQRYLQNNSSTLQGLIVETKIVSSTGGYTYSYNTGTSRITSQGVVAFKEAGGAAATSLPLRRAFNQVLLQL